jgi:hypothetical protein
MCHARIGRRRIEQGLVRLTSVDGTLETVVDVEDLLLGPVAAPLGNILALDDREGLHDVVDIVTLDTVEVEEGRVELAAEEKSPLLMKQESGVRKLRFSISQAQDAHTWLLIPRGVARTGE